MFLGFAIGASSAGWNLAIGGAVGILALYSSLLVGHVMVTIGLLLQPSPPRTALAVLLAVLMWWPALFGNYLWE